MRFTIKPSNWLLVLLLALGLLAVLAIWLADISLLLQIPLTALTIAVVFFNGWQQHRTVELTALPEGVWQLMLVGQAPIEVRLVDFYCAKQVVVMRFRRQSAPRWRRWAWMLLGCQRLVTTPKQMPIGQHQQLRVHLNMGSQQTTHY